VWILASFWLVILNALKFEKYFLMLMNVLDINESKVHDFLVIFAWCILKNVSFNLERIDKENKKENFNIIHCLGYMFYLPTFHTGPHVIYSRYMQMLNKKIPEKGEEFFFNKIYNILILINYFRSTSTTQTFNASNFKIYFLVSHNRDWTSLFLHSLHRHEHSIKVSQHPRTVWRWISKWSIFQQ
jgi:hypothetical protein